jgi:hypothetical protein
VCFVRQNREQGALRCVIVLGALRFLEIYVCLFFVKGKTLLLVHNNTFHLVNQGWSMRFKGEGTQLPLGYEWFMLFYANLPTLVCETSHSKLFN